MLLILWAIVSIVLLAIFSYRIGKSAPTNEIDCRKSEQLDAGVSFIFAIVVAMAWPLVLAIVIVASPFLFIYKMGVNKAKNEQEKKNIWETLMS